MSTYRAFQVTGQRYFELVQRELLGPRPGHVRFRVHSCGVCHSDVLAVEGLRPDPRQPVVPGHEVVGVIDALGEQVSGWSVGDRVGLGFLGGHCGVCVWCRRGDFVNCENQPRPGTTTDGGYAEVVYARATGLVRIPDALASVDASPLLCAGITTYNALQKLNAEPDALVAIQGIGGLGHLGVQYATSWATASLPSHEARARPPSQKSWAHTTTSTAQQSIPARHYSNSVERSRSWPPRPAAHPCRHCWPGSHRPVS